MSITKVGYSVTIICDKCGKESRATDATYNDVFGKEGWALNRGRKYIHLCNKCLPKKIREFHKANYERYFGHNRMDTSTSI